MSEPRWAGLDLQPRPKFLRERLGQAKTGSPKHVMMLQMLSLPRDSICLDIITISTGLAKNLTSRVANRLSQKKLQILWY